MSKLFEEMLKSEEYQRLLSMLPEDERVAILKSLREMVDNFEKTVIDPIKILEDK